MIYDYLFLLGTKHSSNMMIHKFSHPPRPFQVNKLFYCDINVSPDAVVNLAQKILFFFLGE